MGKLSARIGRTLRDLSSKYVERVPVIMSLRHFNNEAAQDLKHLQAEVLKLREEIASNIEDISKLREMIQQQVAVTEDIGRNVKLILEVVTNGNNSQQHVLLGNPPEIVIIKNQGSQLH